MAIESIDTILILSLAVLGFVFGLKRIIKDWNLSNTGDSVMTLMHKELERMSAQNTLLSQELGKLQEEILKLNGQIRQLCIENDKLQTEVVALTTELNAFKKIAAVRKVKVLTNATS